MKISIEGQKEENLFQNVIIMTSQREKLKDARGSFPFPRRTPSDELIIGECRLNLRSSIRWLKGPWRGSSRRFSQNHITFPFQNFKKVKYGSILIYSPFPFPISTIFISFLDIEQIDFEKPYFKSIAKQNQLLLKSVSRLISKLIHFSTKLR